MIAKCQASEYVRPYIFRSSILITNDIKLCYKLYLSVYAFSSSSCQVDAYARNDAIIEFGNDGYMRHEN